MTTSELFAVDAPDISTAWAKAFLRLSERGVQEITPLVTTVQIDDDPLPEVKGIRDALDNCTETLKKSGGKDLKKLQSVHTVANTIFPSSLWNPDAPNDAELLFQRFDATWPRVKKCSQNRRGSYFRRITAFRAKEKDAKPINQLIHIVDTYRGGNHRRSALQAAVFDPTLDHTNSRLLGFPCLHQVSFAPIGESGLSITGYYATQYVFDRAYGNYLGLCRLGHFMAKQLGLKLTRMMCIASVAQRGTPNKGDVSALAEAIRPLVDLDEGSTE